MRLCQQLLSLSNILDGVEFLYETTLADSRIANGHLRKLHDQSHFANQAHEERLLKSQKRSDRLVFCHSCLLQMCRIFIQHTSKARYPDERGWNPLQFFTTDLPLIRLLGDFIEVQEKALKTIRDIYDEIPVFS